jgi:DNA polymerase IV
MPGWDRIFAHVDMDAFYASVEIRDDPSLVGKPVVVGGASQGRGVVSAASYEARKYGIHSAMPMARAEKLCPHLVRIWGSHSKYKDASDIIMNVFRSYSPAIEPLSLDEAFIDLTGTLSLHGPPETIAVNIKRDILKATRLVASVGIAPVKFVAKIASDYDKPDGMVIVFPGTVDAFLHPLDIKRLWGVGPKTQEVLIALGIRTIGDLAAADRNTLAARFGQHGEHLSRLARGEDNRNVVTDWDAKSYSHEHTFGEDQTDAEKLESVMLEESHKVARRMRKDGITGRIIQIKLRYHDFHTLTRRTTLTSATVDVDRIYKTACFLFRQAWTGAPVRLIGVGVSGIQAPGGEALDLFTSPQRQERKRKLVDTIDQIEDRFGTGSVVPAKILRDEEAQNKADPRPRLGEEHSENDY